MSVSHGPSRCAHRVGPLVGRVIESTIRSGWSRSTSRSAPHAVVERLDLVEVDGGGGGGEAPLRAHHFARLTEPDALGGVGKHRPGCEHHLRDEHDGQHRHGLFARPGRRRDQETEAHPRERGDRDVDRELEAAGPERDRVVGPVLGGGGDEHVDDDLQNRDRAEHDDLRREIGRQRQAGGALAPELRQLADDLARRARHTDPGGADDQVEDHDRRARQQPQRVLGWWPELAAREAPQHQQPEHRRLEHEQRDRAPIGRQHREVATAQRRELAPPTAPSPVHATRRARRRPEAQPGAPSGRRRSAGSRRWPGTRRSSRARFRRRGPGTPPRRRRDRRTRRRGAVARSRPPALRARGTGPGRTARCWRCCA